MKVGDLFEWAAGGLGITAAYLGTHAVWVAFAAGAIVLLYEAQCYGASRLPLPRPRLPKLLRRGE